MKQIAEVIEDQVLTVIEPGFSVRTAAQTMTDRNIGAVAVVDAGTLAGIFSARHLMGRAGRRPRASPAEDVRDPRPPSPGRRRRKARRHGLDPRSPGSRRRAPARESDVPPRAGDLLA